MSASEWSCFHYAVRIVALRLAASWAETIEAAGAIERAAADVLLGDALAAGHRMDHLNDDLGRLCVDVEPEWMLLAINEAPAALASVLAHAVLAIDEAIDGYYLDELMRRRVHRLSAAATE